MGGERASDTPDAEVMLARMCQRVLSVLGEQAVGVYPFGSLATGDFTVGVSDIDILVVTVDDVDGSTRDDLQVMHEETAAGHPDWRDRIEVVYLAGQALSRFRTERSALSVISPGEPFHTIDAGSEWLVNWFNAQQTGRVMHGPPLREVMPEVTIAEVRQELRRQLTGWMSRVDNQAQPGFLAYAVLTAARAWDTINHGVVRSKVQSAGVLSQALPQWADLLDAAVSVRASRGSVGRLDADQVAAFLADIADASTDLAKGR